MAQRVPVPVWLVIVLGVLPALTLIGGMVIARRPPAAEPLQELRVTEGEFAEARPGWHERDWVAAWAARHGGQVEVAMADGTRCDIVQDGYAIEADWAHKWTEGVGQSLWYAMQTGKPAGLLLIVATPADERALIRAQSTLAHHRLPIRVWVVR